MTERRPRRAYPVTSLFLLSAALLAFASDCGGKAVVDPASGGSGQGGEGEIVTVSSSSSSSSSNVTTTTTTTSTTTTTTTTSTGGAPPIPPLVQNDLGTVMAGGSVSLDIPPNAFGLFAFALPPNDFDTIGIQTITAPDNTQLVQNYGIPGTLAGYQWFGSVSAGVPQTDDPQAMPLMPGSWSFTVASPDPLPSADVQIWYRQSLDGQFHGGAIDVNVFAVPGLASDGYLNQMVATAFGGVAGLQVGTVNILPLGNEYSVVTDSNVVPMFQETAGAPGKPVLNVMAVSFIDLSQGQPLGFSPGAPGLPLENGTMQSAVVMLVNGDIDLDSFTLRHEGGHFAGLYHTSEIQVGFHDKLSDTPECSNVDQQQQNCPDINNLMFPYANPFGTMDLSPKQEAILQASPIYRGAVEPGGGFAAPLDQSMAKWVAAPSPSATALATGLVAAATEPLSSWKDQVDEAIAHWLQALWCGVGMASSPYDSLVALNPDPAALLAIGTDPSAPRHVRSRALHALGLMNPSAGQIAALETVAGDRGEHRLVRIGAVDGLAEGAPSRLAALRLWLDPDAAVAIVAGRR